MEVGVENAYFATLWKLAIRFEKAELHTKNLALWISALMPRYKTYNCIERCKPEIAEHFRIEFLLKNKEIGSRAASLSRRHNEYKKSAKR